jgi:hypothetical protein
MDGRDLGRLGNRKEVIRDRLLTRSVSDKRVISDKKVISEVEPF